MRVKALVLFLAFLFFANLAINDYISSSRQPAFVSRVIDGDTIELGNGEKVRLLGVNAPEKEEIGYEEAKASLAKAIEGKNVTIESMKKDRYERVLGYVYLNDLSVNLGMIKSGLAHVYFLKSGRYEKLFEDAEMEAMKKEIGIWKKSEIDCITVAEFQWDEGQEKDSNNEWVVFRNDCNSSLDLDGWYVKDEATHIYKFKNVELSVGETLTLITGTGHDSDNIVYWNQKTPIWNNDGDRLFLRDGEGRLALLVNT